MTKVGIYARHRNMPADLNYIIYASCLVAYLLLTVWTAVSSTVLFRLIRTSRVTPIFFWPRILFILDFSDFLRFFEIAKKPCAVRINTEVDIFTSSIRTSAVTWPRFNMPCEWRTTNQFIRQVLHISCYYSRFKLISSLFSATRQETTSHRKWICSQDRHGSWHASCDANHVESFRNPQVSADIAAINGAHYVLQVSFWNLELFIITDPIPNLYPLFLTSSAGQDTSRCQLWNTSGTPKARLKEVSHSSRLHLITRLECFGMNWFEENLERN